MRWKWSSDAEDVGELELEGGRSNSCLLGLGLDDSNACLEGCEGSDEVGWSGGGGCGCHGSLLLLRHGLGGGSALTRGDSRNLDGGDGRGQVGRGDARGGRSDGDGVGVEDWWGCHDGSRVRVGRALDQKWAWIWARVGLGWPGAAGLG
jgi:hypothetical protein